MARMIFWENPTTRVDGSPYAQADNAGYELKINDTPAVAIPVAWGTQFDIEQLEVYKNLKYGTHKLWLAVVDKGGLRSDYAGPATFQIVSPPLAPTALRVA